MRKVVTAPILSQAYSRMPAVNTTRFVPPWEQAGWRAEAEAWARQQAARHSIEITGPAEQVHLQL